MNLELFIAKQIYSSQKKGEKQVSSPSIKLAVAGVAIGLAAMILAVSIVVGFKTEVRNKIIGFGSHIQITNFNNNSNYEAFPICVDQPLIDDLKSREGISVVEPFAVKPGIIKTDTDFQGIILMGFDENHDWSFFQKHLIEGVIPNKDDTTSINSVLISETIARKMNFKVGDRFTTYFIQEPIRARRFEIKGIYNTNFEDYDKLYVITNLKLVQKLNDWEDDQVSGLEISVKDYNNLDEIKQDLFFDMMSYQDRLGQTLYTRSIKEINPSIFSWLDMLDINVWIIICLMLAVSAFTMISGLLIIILEQANTIGMLKTMGMRNISIRKTFLYVSSFLIVKGLIIGNIIAFAIILTQKYTGLIQLNPETYYVSEMPVNINIFYIILLNLGALSAIILTMVGPSYLIAKISPIKALRFE